ncbi:hypothetical protein [Streptomyces gobiensis]|uniref:SCO2584 family spore wall biosynthesis protein n=1 Tax=Streptomyces gobiensis TaxID=2875706 RepID=UPI001E59DBA2|nr:hypothetical protein [Streptomyces gobiensis]UGY91386.1 hypothetical protein test1122_06390 [Streptomyces gobiensis]
MPDDVGGQPFPDGEEPESRDHGAADDEFASVVLDEEFVRAAEVHEPTAAERILAAAQFRAESEAIPPYEEGYGYRPRPDSEFERDGFDDDVYDRDPDEDDEGRFDRSDYGEYTEYAEYVAGRPDPRGGRGRIRWQRPVAWVLAVVMGVGMVAIAFAAVYRGTSTQREEPTPPPVSEMDSSVNGPPGALPSISADTQAPTSAAEPDSS